MLLIFDFWDSVFCERVGVCRPVLFLWEREDRERDARERDAREACAACRRGFVGGWLLAAGILLKPLQNLKLASEAAQTVRIF